MLKNLLLKYRWHLTSILFAVALFIAVFVIRTPSSTDKVIDWVSDKRLKIVEDKIKQRKQKSEDTSDEIKQIQKKIEDVKYERENIHGRNKEATLKELSDVWKGLGY